MGTSSGGASFSSDESESSSYAKSGFGGGWLVAGRVLPGVLSCCGGSARGALLFRRG